MKLVKKILLILLVVIVVFVVFRNPIIKAGIQIGARAAVGLGIEIDKFNLGLSSVEMKGLKVHNPSGFKDKVMVDIPLVYVKCDVFSFLTSKPHIYDIKFHLREFSVIKNEKGEVNINSLKTVKKAQSQEKKKEEPSVKKPSEPITLIVDNLALKVEKVTYKDYSQGEVKVQEYNINLDEKHENIANLNAVVGLILVRTLAKTNIAALASIDLGPVSNLVGSSMKMATEALGKTTEAIDQTTEKTKEALDEATGTLKGVSEGLKDSTESLKGIFKKQ